MKFPTMAVFGLIASLLFADFADAQLFRRSIQRTRTTTVQSCPGGVCTTAQVQTVRTIRSTIRIAPAKVSSDCTFGLRADAPKPAMIPTHILAQVADEPAKAARDSFRSSLVKAIAEQRKAGKISLRDAVKLRVAMLSPAFVDRAHDLAVTQIAFSGVTDASVPVSEDGLIQVNGINWEGLAKFLETFIPLLLTLLKAFGL